MFQGAQTRLIRLGPVVVAALLVVSCSTSASGSINNVCGQKVGTAAGTSQPDYVDGSKQLTARITTAGGGPGDSWVRIIGDCAHGARPMITPPGSLTIDQMSPATDGQPAAVLIHINSGFDTGSLMFPIAGVVHSVTMVRGAPVHSQSVSSP